MFPPWMVKGRRESSGTIQPMYSYVVDARQAKESYRMHYCNPGPSSGSQSPAFSQLRRTESDHPAIPDPSTQYECSSPVPLDRKQGLKFDRLSCSAA